MTFAGVFNPLAKTKPSFSLSKVMQHQSKKYRLSFHDQRGINGHKSEESFKLRQVIGDLFTCQDSLAHCVSEDFKMSAGIAKIFRDKFKRVDELTSQCKQKGEVAVLDEGDRYIYYLVTKRRYFNKPTLFDLKSSLIDLKKHALQNDVKRIGMPLIGCGLDKLKWYDVEKLVREVFKNTHIAITVYKLENGEDKRKRKKGKKADERYKQSGSRR